MQFCGQCLIFFLFFLELCPGFICFFYLSEIFLMFCPELFFKSLDLCLQFLYEGIFFFQIPLIFLFFTGYCAATFL